MTAPVKLPLKIFQGATFREVLRWESSTKIYKTISGINRSAPIQITAANHNVPSGWRVKITNVVGMKEINSNDLYRVATSTGEDTLEINDINAVGYSDYVSGGILEYNAPVSLNNVSARMQLRPSITSNEVLLELTTENNGIIIDQDLYTITIYISPEDTAALNFSSAVYSLELVRGTDVIPFINGTVSLVKEVTR